MSTRVQPHLLLVGAGGSRGRRKVTGELVAEALESLVDARFQPLANA